MTLEGLLESEVRKIVRKGSKGFGLILFLTAILLIGIMAVPVFADAPGVYDIDRLILSGSKETIDLERDITGDGIADKLTVVCSKQGGDQDFFYRRINIAVNGKSPLSYYHKSGFYDLVVKECVLRNGKKYLYLVTEGEDDNPYLSGLFQYSGGKLKSAYDFNHMVKSKKIGKSKSPAGLRIQDLSVKDNSISFMGAAQFSGTGYTYLRFSLTPNKDGTLRRTSNIGEIEYVSGRNLNTKRTYKAQGKLKVYKSATSKKVKFKLKKGTKVKVQKVYFGNKKARILIRTTKGKTGWVDMLTGVKVKYKSWYGSGTRTGHIFNNLGSAG